MNNEVLDKLEGMFEKISEDGGYSFIHGNQELVVDSLPVAAYEDFEGDVWFLYGIVNVLEEGGYELSNGAEITEISNGRYEESNESCDWTYLPFYEGETLVGFVSMGTI